MNILKFILKQFEFRKTFDRVSAGKLAVFGDLAAILKIKQKFLFGIINSLLWRLQISNIDRFQKRPHPPPPLLALREPKEKKLKTPLTPAIPL